MSDVILDSSAIMAVLNSEPGQDIVFPLLQGAQVSTLIVAEVATILVRTGWQPEAAAERIEALELIAHDFTYDRAIAAGLLMTRTAGAGLSLADRACVALALELDLPVFTADRSWALVKNLDFDLHLIR
jgi:PIN domain nuclease of toxin-antitoxin system